MSLSTSLVSSDAQISDASNHHTVDICTALSTYVRQLVCVAFILDKMGQHYYEIWLFNCLLSAATAVYSMATVGPSALSSSCIPSFCSSIGAFLTFCIVFFLLLWLHRFWYEKAKLQQKIDRFGIFLNMCALISVSGKSLCFRGQKNGTSTTCVLDCSVVADAVYILGSLYHAFMVLLMMYTFSQRADRSELVWMASGSCIFVPIIVMCYLL